VLKIDAQGEDKRCIPLVKVLPALDTQVSRMRIGSGKQWLEAGNKRPGLLATESVESGLVAQRLVLDVPPDIVELAD